MHKFEIIAPDGSVVGKGDNEELAFRDACVCINELGNWHDYEDEGDTGISYKDNPNYYKCVEC